MKITFYYVNPVSKYKKFGNFILRSAEDTEYGHFAIGCTGPSNIETVYEAVFPRFHKISKEEFLLHYEIYDSISWEVPEDIQYRVFDFLEGFVGKRYALEQILFIGLTILLFPLNILFKSLSLNGNKALVCTELGSRFAEKFFGFVPKESHDKIGLKDMLVIGYKYKDIKKWALHKN